MGSSVGERPRRRKMFMDAGGGRMGPIGRALVPHHALRSYFLGASAGMMSNLPLDTTKMTHSAAGSHFVTCLAPCGWYS